MSIAVLAWAASGLLYALPDRVEGGKVQTIETARVRIAPQDAMRRADEFAGRRLPTTALTLLMRDGRPVYQSIGGMGADSLLVDAETGAVIKTPPPNLATRLFRQAHFYYFAGRLQTPLLVIASLLACLLAISGIYLNLTLWHWRFTRKRRTANRAWWWD